MPDKDITANQIYCPEIYNGYDIDLITSSIAHCCKQKPSTVTLNEVNLHGYKIFDLNSVTVAARKDFDNNIRTATCVDCWDNEDNGIKSWRQIYIERAANDVHNQIRINLQLSNLCNQSCFYCHPHLSSTIDSFGYWIDSSSGKKTKTVELNSNRIPSESKNILNFEQIIKFIGDLPVTSKSLVVGITGGEPFIVNKFNENLEELITVYFKNDPNKELMFAFASNGNVKPENLLEFYEKIKQLKTKYNIVIKAGLSIENLFERAEYVRHGLKWDNFIDNLKIHCNNADTVTLQLTSNVFSVVNISDFVKYFKDYKLDAFTYGYVGQPFFRLNILDQSFKLEVQKLEDYLKSNNIEHMFKNYKNLYSLNDDKVNASKFKFAITNLDEIRGTNWRTVFPEYTEWFDKI